MKTLTPTAAVKYCVVCVGDSIVPFLLSLQIKELLLLLEGRHHNVRVMVFNISHLL